MVITIIILFYNTEWQYDNGMAVNCCGKIFYNIDHCVIELFTPLNVRNKLECLSLVILMFEGKGRSLPKSGLPQKSLQSGRLPPYSQIID
jgi:hypothetical protein